MTKPESQTAKNEGYPDDWKRAIVIVSPDGRQVHAIGGDSAPKSHPDDEDIYPAFELLQKRMAKQTFLNADQVAWIKDALDRRDYMKSPRFPRISRIAAMADAAFMLELSEIIGAKMDDNAKHNATPIELRPDCCQGEAVNVA